ncbi:Na+/H+ antiporter NhaD/arsenite permease-like protein [Geodermatophilus normandii]|uniref:Na+/H+ antiporter NhaD/arsenite permease-like protein n=1 Tax=Geodermatophilus normandii TaxID=1137989 RepID=A0A317QDK3_9ACTN|nr:SLC13 family permease [Geodermatophilus normandii]PWW21432.1 Na+/H+ antiporter NhaD/arsenite permease-like protein [Geodermatophilus normandii]
MSPEIVTILALVAIFAIATFLPINMGALAFVAAFLVGTLSVGLSTDDILTGFPAELVVTLIGVTYLFAIAQNNGTVDLLVRGAVRLVGGYVAAIPWVMFAVTALLTAIGALSPAAVAIVAPIALGFAARYDINPLLMGMMVVHGAQGGGFSPISVYGLTVNEIVEQEGLPSSPVTVFFGSLLFNMAIGVVLFLVLGGRKLIGRRVSATVPAHVEHAEEPVVSGHGAPPGPAVGPDHLRDDGADGTADGAPPRVTLDQVLTLVGLVTVAVLALVFDLDIGFVSITVATVLALFAAARHKGAVSQISWSTVLLIAGVLTFVFVLQEAGTIDYVGEAVIGLGIPLLIALLLCYIGGVVSAFASSTAIIGVAIALAVPFLLSGDVGAVGVVVALSVASTIVDVSPFSTNGALVLANAQGVDRDRFYKQMLAYAGIVVAVGPLLAWLVFVVPGWL